MESLCLTECYDGILRSIHEVLRRRGHSKTFQASCTISSLLTNFSKYIVIDNQTNTESIKAFTLSSTSVFQIFAQCKQKRNNSSIFHHVFLFKKRLF